MDVSRQVTGVSLHWHRRDLRLADNPAAGAGDEPVIGLYVFDPGMCERMGDVRASFLLAAVDELREQYDDRGGTLVIRQGKPETIVPKVATTLGNKTVTWETQYGRRAAIRDNAVRQALRSQDVTVLETDGSVIHPPGSITTTKGTPYQVFTPYWRSWQESDVPEPSSEPAMQTTAVAIPIGELPTNLDLGCDAVDIEVPAATVSQATNRLESFCSAGIYTYADRRDDPAEDGTSRLSSYLAHGQLGPRTVWEATVAAARAANTDEERESVESFQRQLGWREFYAQVLWDHPDLETDPVQEFPGDIEWRNDDDELQAWKEGETGFPIVDAGMRQLSAEGWMHNRLRMIVASFLTKDLLVDWRHGYEWFRSLLLDHTVANDAGGWQWAASTGTDPQPYFRVFNPWMQGERHDPDATFIRSYVPELEAADPDVIHNWHELARAERREHAPSYPDPIVTHADRREAAIEMYEAARSG